MENSQLEEVTTFKSANLEIKFKNEKEDEGCEHKDILELLIRRIEILQDQNPCPEYHMQLFHLQELIHWDEIRKKVRDGE